MHYIEKVRREDLFIFFFFNDTATTEIYTLSLHDALPIWQRNSKARSRRNRAAGRSGHRSHTRCQDRKSTRLNSSHSQISYAVFCLKKKKKNPETRHADISNQRSAKKTRAPVTPSHDHIS